MSRRPVSSDSIFQGVDLYMTVAERRGVRKETCWAKGTQEKKQVAGVSGGEGREGELRHNLEGGVHFANEEGHMSHLNTWKG